MPGNQENAFVPNSEDTVEFTPSTPSVVASSELASGSIEFDSNALQELTGASSLSELRGENSGEVLTLETSQSNSGAEMSPEAHFALQQEAIAAIPKEDPVENQRNIDAVLAKLKPAREMVEVAPAVSESVENSEAQEPTEEGLVSDMEDFVGEETISELGGGEGVKTDTLTYAEKLFGQKKSAQQGKRDTALLSLGLGGVATFAAGIATGPAFLGTSALALSVGGPLILAGGALAAGGYAVWGGMKLWHKYKNKKGEKIIEDLRIKKAQSLRRQSPPPLKKAA